MQLDRIPGTFSICRMDPSDAIPQWAQDAPLSSITRTNDELSVVCESAHVPRDVKHDRGWACLKIEGPLDFGLVGVLHSMLEPLLNARVPVFCISTFDTDYVLISEGHFTSAIEALKEAGHRIRPSTI